MKNLMCFVMVFIASSMASAKMIEDFEGYNPGVLSAQGWVFAEKQDGEVIKGTNGTKVAQAFNFEYMQGTHGAAKSQGNTYPTGFDVSKPGKAYFAAQMRPGLAGGLVPYTVIGTQRADGYPGVLIGINVAEKPVENGRDGRFCFESSAFSSLQNSEDIVMFNESGEGYIFDMAVELDIVSITEIYATLYYRNVSLGGDWLKSAILSHVPFANTFEMQKDARTYIRGYVRTEIDNFQIGMGDFKEAIVTEKKKEEEKK